MNRWPFIHSLHVKHHTTIMKPYVLGLIMRLQVANEYVFKLFQSCKGCICVSPSHMHDVTDVNLTDGIHKIKNIYKSDGFRFWDISLQITKVVNRFISLTKTRKPVINPCLGKVEWTLCIVTLIISCNKFGGKNQIS